MRRSEMILAKGGRRGIFASSRAPIGRRLEENRCKGGKSHVAWSMNKRPATPSTARSQSSLIRLGSPQPGIILAGKILQLRQRPKSRDWGHSHHPSAPLALQPRGLASARDTRDQ